MKKIFAFCFLCFAISTGAFAQKTAYVEETLLLQKLEGYETAIKHFDSISKVFATDMQQIEKDLSTRIATLLVPYKLSENLSLDQVKQAISESDKQKLELLLKEKELAEMKMKNYEYELDNYYSTNVTVLLNKLNKTIEDYAKKNKIEMVYIFEKIKGTLAYIDTSKNITQEIIKLL